MKKEPKRWTFQGKKYTYDEFEKLMGGKKKVEGCSKCKVSKMFSSSYCFNCGRKLVGV